MRVDVQTLWLLCALTATVCASAAATWRRALVMAGAFALASVTIGSGSAPGPGVCGALAAAAAAASLAGDDAHTRRERLYAFASIALGGALAAASGSLLAVQGVPRIAALAIGAALPLVSARFSARRPEFAPVGIREDALMAVVAFGLLVAVVPSVADGWRSAVALNARPAAAVADAQRVVPVWTLAVTMCALVAGGVFASRSAWRRG